MPLIPVTATTVVPQALVDPVQHRLASAEVLAADRDRVHSVDRRAALLMS
jgi:hypothetical protein